MTKAKLTGLVAATHTPFQSDGALNLSAVEKQADHLLRNRVETAFIGGTTGEWSSLTLDERRQLTNRWIEVTRDSRLKVIVHVGANCLADSQVLARQAQQLGAFAISALAPSYFKPATISLLVQSMAEIANAAPELPFYYYEIPSLTGIALSPSAFLEQGVEQIPNLAGVKFTNTNLMEFQLCAAVSNHGFDIPFGVDEMLLAGLSMGAVGAVGSTYNFAAPLYHRLMGVFATGDLATARIEQFRSVQMVAVLARRGYMGAAKALMAMLGVDVGPARLPHGHLPTDQQSALKRELEELGFFNWLK
jgi:N-acetylneuraminate lyase